MWGWIELFSWMDIRDGYSKLNRYEPKKYIAGRRKVILFFLMIILISMGVHAYYVFRCESVTNEYKLCRYYWGDIDAVKRVLEKRKRH